ncbi:MAG: fatty acid cis/trans isomerase [Spongiibacteraceae bacterium]|nr:fatty acid cis/trans isomerase [Spongiibacteraceae bacterium]
MRGLIWALLVTVLVGCAAIAGRQLDAQFGAEDVRLRATSADYRTHIAPILESRCVVCHGCYDAPCQLKLSSFEGLERGGHKTKVYDGTRLLTASLTRLYVDETRVEGWRQRGFFPVLNERSAAADLHGSVLARMLALKQAHPLPDQAVLPDSFDFSLDRNQQCPRVEEFDSYARDYPLWGMPYGLPALSDAEHRQLVDWLAKGAPGPRPLALSPAERAELARWEEFLNQPDNKARLMSRYIYEHLFLGALYFANQRDGRFYELVRSRTPPGEPIDLIASRRPYDDPGVEAFYYRLRPRLESVLVKTHMPYLLDDARMARWREWFLEADYQITALPGYTPQLAANPFATFAELPVRSRYRYMLDEAQYTIMGFIKGPVCRGQVALNVINDHFWVVFVDPDRVDQEYDKAFLAEASKDLGLPVTRQSNVMALADWLAYSREEKAWQMRKGEHLRQRFADSRGPALDIVWSGDGVNTNAALTVFRHFDSATVVRGLVGDTPQTTWLVSYSLLERIHYLLVAGFDVYGNVGHQLVTRLYMDFLRMEGEQNFLALLPDSAREEALAHWYREAPEEAQQFVGGKWFGELMPSQVVYHSEQPLPELRGLLKQRLDGVLDRRHSLRANLAPAAVSAALRELELLPWQAVALLPQTSVLLVDEGSRRHVYTLVHNNAHLNVSSLFDESKRRVPKEDTVTVVSGVLGAYPNQLLRVNAGQMQAFSQTVAAMTTEADYAAMLSRYGVRRSDPDFWAHSDELHRLYRAQGGVEAGWLDFNRLDNR